MPYTFENEPLGELIKEAREEKLLLPNFQRDFAWAPREQASLAASVVLGIPTGALLLLKGESGEYSSRVIGNKSARDAQESETDDCRFLLDGQQRMSTLRQIFGNPYRGEWEVTHDLLWHRLRYRWSLDLSFPADDGNSDEARFGLHVLKFEEPPFDWEIVDDWFVAHKIRKGDEGNPPWFHPAFEANLQAQGQGLHITTDKVADEAAKHGFVPLWGLLHSDDHELKEETDKAVRSVASRSFSELKSRYADGNLPDALIRDLVHEGRAESKEVESMDEAVDAALRQRKADWVTAFRHFLLGVRDYKFPIIDVPSGQSSDAIVIFEAINRSGKPLNAFDLLNARYAKVDLGKSLSEQIVEYVLQLDKELSYNRSNVILDGAELTPLFKTLFHQGLTMLLALDDFSDERVTNLSTGDVKKSAALELSAEQVSTSWKRVTEAIHRSWQFLQTRCSVPTEKTLRNKMLALPLMAAFLSPESERPPNIDDYLLYYFWTSTLTSRLSTAQNERANTDIQYLLSWILGRIANPFTDRKEGVFGEAGYSDLAALLGEEDEDSGTGIGLYFHMFVNSKPARDLITDKPLFVTETDVEVHHIIPLGSVAKVGDSTQELRKDSTTDFGRLMNSPLNKCYISRESNRAISSKSLDQYSKDVTKEALALVGLQIDPEESLRGYTDDDDGNVRRLLTKRFEHIRNAWLLRVSELELQTER